MEDAHTIQLSLPDDEEASFFAVFDGHGGAKVANYASENLFRVLTAHQFYQEGRIEDALKSAFVEFDEMMFNDEKMRDELAGSTAVIVLIKQGNIYCVRFRNSVIFFFAFKIKILFFCLFACRLISVILELWHRLPAMWCPSPTTTSQPVQMRRIELFQLVAGSNTTE